jgi:hypothetical protein
VATSSRLTPEKIPRAGLLVALPIEVADTRVQPEPQLVR